MRNIEQELKILLTQREYEILQQVANAQPKLQTNYYFATDDMPTDTMVRLRQKGEVYLLCYKKLISQAEGVNVCDERECQISYEFAQSFFRRGIATHEMRDLLGVSQTEPLFYVGKLDTLRTTFEVEGCTVELDKNTYLGITDYELECEHTDVAKLHALAHFLFYKYGIVFKQSQSKVARFFAQLNG